MRQQIPQLSTSYNYESAQQVNNVVANINASINYYLTPQQLRPEPTGNVNTHPRSKPIKESKLETESPLAEKDEVKKAEQRTMEQQKRIDKKQPPKKDK